LLAAAVAPLAAIDAMIAPEPAAQSGVTHRSFCLSPCEITPRAAFARSAARCARGPGTARTELFRSIQNIQHGTEHRAK
jgi:hypothetical protein